MFIVGVTLYWAEGGKDKSFASREQVQFINSDVTVIRVFLDWLRLLGSASRACGRASRSPPEMTESHLNPP
jgi:hypothetical protein